MNKKLNHYRKSIARAISRFGDIRFTGQLIFLAIVLLIFWSGAKAIQSNYNLQQQEAELKQQNQLAQLQNTTIALQNEYYNSKQYLDLSSRQNFGLADPGEKELLVPANVALNYTEPIPESSSVSQTTQTGKQSNYQAWINFFFRRNTFKS